MRWSTFEVDSEWPLGCVCCGELVPDEDQPPGEAHPSLFVVGAWVATGEEASDLGTVYLFDENGVQVVIRLWPLFPLVYP